MKYRTPSINTGLAVKAAVVLALCTSPVALLAQELDRTSPPDVPYEVNGAVYSSTAAEIFWPMYPDPTGVTYSVFRNGESVSEFSTGLSHFDGNLSPNTDYTYCVYVIADTVQLAVGQTTLVTASNGSDVMQLIEAGTCPSLAPLPPGASPLRSDVYSSTALEIFWGKDENPDATYNLFRDGVLLTKNRSGTSYFEDNLEPNTQYTYCLYDIVNNTVTDAEAITVTTRDNGAGGQPMPPAGTCPFDPLAGGGVPIPVEPPITVGELNLTGEIYSQTSLEIFWDRVPSPEVLYNVFRDGELVLANSRANSFYDPDLQPGDSVVYSVTGGANGNTSTSAAITLGTQID